MGVAEAAGDTQAEVSVQHSQIVELAAGTVQQVVGSEHYWEAVVVVVSRAAAVLGSWQRSEFESTPAVAVAVKLEQNLLAGPEVEVMA